MVANAMHLHLLTEGTYTPADEKVEIWAITLNLGLFYELLTVSPDDQGALPGDYAVSSVHNTSVQTNWTTESDWLATVFPSIDFDPVSYLDDQVMPAQQTMWPATAVSTKCVPTKTSLYLVGQNGKGVIPGSFAASTWTTPPAMGGSGSMLPAQDALGISTQSNRLGKKGRGRFYLPGTTPDSLTTEGRISPAVQAVYITTMVAYLEALSLGSAPADNVFVRPIVTGRPFTQYGFIDSIRVSDLCDTQRRRRDRLVPSYAHGTTSY
jgi:hypothetical protein